MLPSNRLCLSQSFKVHLSFAIMSQFGDDEPEGSFSIFFAEGEVLAKQGQYQKAVESFTKALEFQPEDKYCLVARSKCYLQLGDATAALKDAEESLKEDNKYHKGLFQKAEAFYSMGNFEYALVFYHRGHKIRPELHEFTLGIQKAQEAIDNSIGTPAACKLEKIGDLTFFQQQDRIAVKKPKKLMRGQQQLRKEKAERKPVATEKTTKELLGEMYSDKEYLERLLKDPGLVIGLKDRSIYNTVENALTYLDARTEFWRQQKPMYARKREKEAKKYRPSPSKSKRTKDGSDHTKFMLKSLEEVDNALAEGDAETSLQQAQKLMKTVQELSERDLPNRSEFIASLYSCIGNAHLELGEAESALKNHLEDLKIAEEEDLTEIQGRALDNIGRVYSVMGQFEKAAKYWTRKLHLVKTAEESTWLYHELGRCNLELGRFEAAKEHGEKSLSAAREAQDKMWQLNASVLIAQADTKLENFQAAMQQFEQSMELAKLLEDQASQDAIVKALEEVNSKIVEGLKSQEGSKVESNIEVTPVH